MQTPPSNKKKEPQSLKGLLCRYLIVVAIEIGLLFAYFGLVNLFQATETKEIYRLLSNGFSCIGLIALGVGLLIYFSTMGAYNFLSFTALKIASKFVHSMPIATMSYGDYVESKKKSYAKFGYLLITGSLFLLVGIIFLCLFYTI